MIVLHILLIILKLLGILLLVIFGLLLLVLLSMLLCPVGYRLQGTKSQEGCQGTVMVYWLFHLISVKGFSEGREKKQGFSVRIFGIPLEKLQGFLKKRENRKKQQLSKKRRRSYPTLYQKKKNGSVCQRKRKLQYLQTMKKSLRKKKILNLRILLGKGKPLFSKGLWVYRRQRSLF